MKRQFALLDLIFAILTLLALLVPLVQLASSIHVEQTEAQLARRYARVCNVEGNLCVIASGSSADRAFGRLLPGQ